MEEKTAGRGFLILSIAGILGKLLSVLYVPILMEIIGKEGYGIYSVGYDYFIFLIAVSSLGAQPAVTKVVTELRVLGNGRDALRAMKIARKYLAIIGGIITILFMIFAFPMAKLFKVEQSGLTFMFLAPAIFIAAILASYRGYMQGIEDMKTLAISQVLEQLFNVILSLVFAFLLFKIGGEVWGSAGGTMGTTLGAIVAIVYILYIYEKNEYDDNADKLTTTSKKVSDKKILRKLIIYGLPITLVAAMQNFAGIVDALTVNSRLLFAGFTESEKVSYYAYLNQYKTMIYVPLTIITALATSIFPRIIQAFVEKNKKELRRQMSYSFRLTYIIAIPAVVGLSILSREIYILVFGDAFKYELLMFGSVVLILMSITTIQNVILQGINKMYLIMVTAGLGLIAKFLCNYFLVGIESINIMGAVIGNVLAFGIPAVINHIKLQKTFKVKIPIIRQSIIPLISSIAMGFVIFFIKEPLLRVLGIVAGEGRIITGILVLILITIGGVVYLILMIYFGGIRKIDLDMISPRLYRLMPRKLRKQIR